MLPELLDKQMQLRERLFIDELLQAFAGGPQREHVLVAQMATDQIEN